MRHSTAAAIGWSRFETAKAIERAMADAPERITERLRQGLSQSRSGRS
jgi:hypothetical protein